MTDTARIRRLVEVGEIERLRLVLSETTGRDLTNLSDRAVIIGAWKAGLTRHA